MKTTFTLLVTFVAIFQTSPSLAQITEGFENTGGDAYYTSQGWSFTGMSWDGTSQMSQVGSLRIIPTTSSSIDESKKSNWGRIITPSRTYTGAQAISFTYKLSNSLAKTAGRTFTVKSQDAGTGTTTLLGSFNILDVTPANVIFTSPSIMMPASASPKKIVIELTGDGDGNTYTYFDNLSMAPAVGAITLPVRLLQFSGSLVNSKTELIWSVAENETGSHFDIEKSADGKNFNSLGILFNTDKVGNDVYSFRDGAALTATAFYRLKVVNKDNSVSYSKIAILSPEKTAIASNLSLLQNPVEATLSFQYKASAAGNNSIAIYNAMGVKVHSLAMNMQKGLNSVSLTLDSKINTGAYFLEISNGTEKSIVKMLKK